MELTVIVRRNNFVVEFMFRLVNRIKNNLKMPVVRDHILFLLLRTCLILSHPEHRKNKCLLNAERINLFNSGKLLWKTGSRLLNAGKKLRIAGDDLHVAGTALLIAGIDLHTAGTNLHFTGTNLFNAGIELRITGTDHHIAGTYLHVAGTDLGFTGTDLQPGQRTLINKYKGFYY